MKVSMKRRKKKSLTPMLRLTPRLDSVLLLEVRYILLRVSREKKTWRREKLMLLLC